MGDEANRVTENTEENSVSMSSNDTQRIAELEEYSRAMDEELEAKRINDKEARLRGDKIFRIVFGTGCLIALGIVFYRYLR